MNSLGGGLAACHGVSVSQFELRGHLSHPLT
jgi:hypothetical protein